MTELNSAVDYSLSETESLAKQATRGAGLPWGLAIEVGQATRILACHGLPGPALLIHILQLHELHAYADLCPESTNLPLLGNAHCLSPIAVGTLISDDIATWISKGHTVINQVYCPWFTLPFLARALTGSGCKAVVQWNNTRVLCADNHIAMFDDCVPSIEDETYWFPIVNAECQFQRGSIEQPDTVGRHELSSDTLQRLKAYAARTYAPATAESRIRGAGAADDESD